MKKYHFFILFGLFTKICFSQVNFTSSNLPIIIINTNGKAIPDEPKIDATIGIIDNGPGKENKIADPFTYFGKIGIEERGQSSTMFPKKQYGFETRNVVGEDTSVSILGMPAESDWVLNANYLDKTFLRNYLAYKLYNDMGRYATRTKFCEMILNGNYNGLYILQEKIKRDKKRVNISKMETTDISGDNITGGYIIRIDKLDQGDVYWTSTIPPYAGTSARVNYLYYIPKPEDITPEQKKYIKDYVTAFENSWYSTANTNPFPGYYSFINIDSFVDMFILNEFTKATDGYRISNYLHKDRDSKNGKLTMGPPWDYDIAFGVADYDYGYDPTGWQVNYHNRTYMENPNWCTQLFADGLFKNLFTKRWNTLKQTVLNPTKISLHMDSVVTTIKDAVTRNSARWPNLFNGSYVWPNKNTFRSYDQELSYLKNWITLRVNWINQNIPATFSDIEWKYNKLSNVDGLKKEVRYPLSSFVGNKQNISTIEFIPDDAGLSIRILGDEVIITANKAGENKFKGIATFNGSLVSISQDYSVTVITSMDNKTGLPDDFQLEQNYPNPFNPSTIITYRIPEICHVTLKIFDILGREIAILVNTLQQPGIYNSQFSILKSELQSGVYFYTLKAGDYISTKRMVLIK